MPLIALLLVTWSIIGAARVLGDMITDAIVANRASKAGQWDVIDRQAERREARRAARRQAWTAAWSARRRARHERAGGDGEFQPGFGAYWDDLMAGFWARRIEVRRAKRAARGPYIHDPSRPSFAERVDAAILARLGQVRDALKGEQPQPTPDSAPQVEPPGATDLPPGTWTVGDDGEQVPLAPTDPQPEPAVEPDSTPEPIDNSAPTGTTEEAPTMDPVAEEVTSNEELRRNFDRMRDAAARGRDALAVVEAARQEIAAAARASADGTAAKKFDEAATTAANEVDEQVNLGTLSQWSEVFDNAHAAAESGKASLDKYRDAEDVVASNNVDASTLESTSA